MPVPLPRQKLNVQKRSRGVTYSDSGMRCQLEFQPQMYYFALQNKETADVPTSCFANSAINHSACIFEASASSFGSFQWPTR